MIVTVTAPAGAFPEGAELVVKRVPVYAEAYREADAAIDALRDEAQNVAVSYAFDIKVIDPVTGEELQPVDGHDVEVTFALAEASDANLDANVYHVTEDELTGAVCAEALETDVDAGAVTAVSDGFSVYVVEFTYNTKEYVMQGGDSVALADILDFVGISGAVSSVTVDPSNGLLTVAENGGEYTVSSAGVFAGEAKLTVAVGNQTYEIIVTCYQKTLYYRDTDGDLATLEGWTPLTEGVSAWGKPGETTWLALTQKLDIDTRITVSGTVNLILCDGCTLKANRGVTVADGDALTIYGGALGAGHIEGTGKLSANAAGVANAAGIGGGARYNDEGGSGSKITISGGAVTATGGESVAGIGGGWQGSGSDITVSGGTVEAIGSYGGKAVGNGSGGSGDSTPTIGDGLKVAAGASRRSAMVYLYADRGTACKTNEYALIEPCADGEHVFDPKSHLCKYCGAEQAKVSVVFAPSDTKTVAPGEDSSFTAKIGVESAKLTDYAVPVYAEKGDAVTLTFAVAEGYEIKKVEVQDKNGKAVNVGVKNGKYTLTMRGSDVTVTAALKFVPTVTAPEAKDLTYNGQQQELVYLGDTNVGWMEYAFAPDVGERFTPKEGDYSKNIPTRDIGRECYVWYTNNGDSIHINPSGVTVKYPTMTVRVGNLEKIKPTLHKASKGKFCSHVNEIRYLSSNPKVATVSSSGKVTGRSGGTCIVYALTINGLYATTTVNVDPSPFKISFKTRWRSAPRRICRTISPSPPRGHGWRRRSAGSPRTERCWSWMNTAR